MRYNPIMATKKVLKDISTEGDNHTFDASKILWITSCVSYIGIAIISAMKGHPFDAMAFGAGLGAVLGGGGVAVRLNTEQSHKK